MVQAVDRAGDASDRLGRLAAGSHVCWVVDSAIQFDAMAAECLAEGAARNEKLLRFSPRDRLADLPAGPPAVGRDPSLWVLGGGPFDPAAMWAMFRRASAAARHEGYAGIRLVADMDWMLACLPGLPELTRFELRLDELAAELGATVVCAYREGSFPAPVIAEVAAVHQHTAGRAPADVGFRAWSATAGVWGLAGEVDISNEEAFSRVLEVAAEGGSPLRLRVSDLRFMGVAGINALLRLANSRPELRVLVEDADPLFRLSWKLLELDRGLPGVEFVPAPGARYPRASAPPVAEGGTP